MGGNPMSLRIEILRRDSGGVLRCTRADGTTAFQTQSERHAPFFALHDLTHFAVETTLGYRNAFYGLIAQGWSIDDTEGSGPRGPLPPEALEVEVFVGMLDAERAGGVSWTADEFQEFAALHAAAHGHSPPRRLSNVEYAAIQSLRVELFAKWAAVSPGESLTLDFPG